MPDIEAVVRGDEQTRRRLSTGELSSVTSFEIPIMMWLSSHCGCQSTARVCLGDGCGRGADYGGMHGLCGQWLPWSLPVKLYPRSFPEASKRTGDGLPSLPRIKVASTFSQTFSLPAARIYYDPLRPDTLRGGQL